MFIQYQILVEKDNDCNDIYQNYMWKYFQWSLIINIAFINTSELIWLSYIYPIYDVVIDGGGGGRRVCLSLTN